MAARYVHDGVGFVELGGGGAGSAADQFPSPPLADGVNTGTSDRDLYTAVASGTPHSPGSYTEIDPSLSADAAGVWIRSTVATFSPGTNTSTLLEFATGAGGAETVIATVAVGYIAVTNDFNYPIFVPLSAAAGSRVSFRARSVVASKSVTISAAFVPQKSTALGAPVTIGVDTANSRGTVITPHASLNTKSAWTELTASSASALSVVTVCCQPAGSTAVGSAGALVDIGTGGAGSETVIIADLPYIGTTSETWMPRFPTTFGVSIPAGTRIAARFAQAHTGCDADVFLTGAA